MKPLFKSPEFSESCNSTGRLLRVVDILREEEENDRDCAGNFGMSDTRECLPGGLSTNQCLSLRRIIARWVASFRRPKRRREVEEVKRDKEPGESDGRLTCTRCSMNGLDGGTSSSSSTESVGPGPSRKEDTSFNLGVGCSLLFLVLASRNELNKMVDLRRQMELFLQDVKEELGRKDHLFVPFQSNTDAACSFTDCQEDPCSTSQLSYQQDFSSQILSDAQSTIPNHFRKSCLHEEGEHEERIDELESEFEAELERLQFHLEAESSSRRIEHLRIKTMKNTDSTRSYCMSSSGEVIDPQEDVSEGQDGVPPIELERKLHELLEAKQQERIKELEGALECAKQEANEKESEVSWWKETAKVISQHIPAHSRLRLASQHDQLFRRAPKTSRGKDLSIRVSQQTTKSDSFLSYSGSVPLQILLLLFWQLSHWT